MSHMVVFLDKILYVHMIAIFGGPTYFNRFRIVGLDNNIENIFLYRHNTRTSKYDIYHFFRKKSNI
jgi:hypothetical protein